MIVNVISMSGIYFQTMSAEVIFYFIEKLPPKNSLQTKYLEAFEPLRIGPSDISRSNYGQLQVISTEQLF